MNVMKMLLMHKKLTDKQWLEIKTRYGLGDGIRELARCFDIPHGTIQQRIKREGWTRELSDKVSNIKQSVQEISQMADVEQLPIIENKIHDEVNDTLGIIKNIKNLDKGALNLHGFILKRVIDDTKSRKMSPKEAVSILSSAGLKVDQIANRNLNDSNLANPSNEFGNIQPPVIIEIVGVKPNHDQEI